MSSSRHLIARTSSLRGVAPERGVELPILLPDSAFACTWAVGPVGGGLPASGPCGTVLQFGLQQPGAQRVGGAGAASDTEAAPLAFSPMPMGARSASAPAEPAELPPFYWVATLGAHVGGQYGTS